MSKIGDFETTFLKCVENVLASVPSDLSFEAQSVWTSALMDFYLHLRDTALFLTMKNNESDKF